MLFGVIVLGALLHLVDGDLAAAHLVEGGVEVGTFGINAAERPHATEDADVAPQLLELVEVLLPLLHLQFVLGHHHLPVAVQFLDVRLLVLHGLLVPEGGLPPVGQHRLVLLAVLVHHPQLVVLVLHDPGKLHLQRRLVVVEPLQLPVPVLPLVLYGQFPLPGKLRQFVHFVLRHLLLGLEHLFMQRVGGVPHALAKRRYFGVQLRDARLVLPPPLLQRLDLLVARAELRLQALHLLLVGLFQLLIRLAELLVGPLCHGQQTAILGPHLIHRCRCAVLVLATSCVQQLFQLLDAPLQRWNRHA
mmetsp:Transcript_92103/g.159755  ORF Transcript_92103/g.159755 Transcript_92103/m.159755 type:complete len:303 (-) Transcript_92103:580-1488(-)